MTAIHEQSPAQAGITSFDAVLDSPFGEALERTKAALKSEGFGVLTTIDVAQTLKEKIGVDLEPYLILGACNPNLAHRALEADRAVGLLLPCNVTVREQGGRVAVSIVDPMQMLGFAGDNLALAKLAREADAKLRRVAETLSRPAL